MPFALLLNNLDKQTLCIFNDLLVTETVDGRESIFPEGIDLDDSNDDNDLTANIEEEEGEANERVINKK